MDLYASKNNRHKRKTVTDQIANGKNGDETNVRQTECKMVEIATILVKKTNIINKQILIIV